MVVIPVCVFSQNYNINPHVNQAQPSNTDANQDISYNQNKFPQQITVQKTHVQVQSADNGAIVITNNSNNSGFSGISFSTGKYHAKAITHKRKNGSNDFFEKLFDKKFKTTHHYKKKSRMKKCASFI